MRECARSQSVVAGTRTALGRGMRTDDQLSVSTPCRSVEDFVAGFHRTVRDDAIFIATSQVRAIDDVVAFVIVLVDGTPVLRGSGIVIAVSSTGLELRIAQLSPRSVPVFERLQVARLSNTVPSWVAPPPRTVVTRQYFSPVARPSTERELSFETPTKINPQSPPPQASRRLPRVWLPSLIVCVSMIGSIGERATLAESESEHVPVGIPAPPPPPPGPLIVGTGPCRFDVASSPAGADVAVDGTLRGTSPLAIATECGTHRIDISRVRYQTMTVWAAVAGDRPEPIDVALARPIHTVWIATRPAGAQIVIDGHAVGQTPTALNVLGYVPVALELRKPGYRAAMREIYSIVPRDAVVIPLVKR